MLSTKVSIDTGEKTTETAEDPAVFSSKTLARDDEISIDIDQVGSGVAGAGLKVIILGARL